MLGIKDNRWTPYVVGAALVVVNLAAMLILLFVTSTPHYLEHSSGERSRNLNLIPYAVLALSLLAVGLMARRWLQAALAPVLIAAGGFWWLTWVMNLPHKIQEDHWSIGHANHLISVYGTTWDVVATALVIVGWGLVRRNGWLWLLGLLPGAVVVTAAQLLEHAYKPDKDFVVDGGIEAFFRHFSHEMRVQGLLQIGLNALAVVLCVWLCVLADRRLDGPAAAAAIATEPPPPPPPAPSADSQLLVPVADEIRKLAELRDAGVLTDAEFEARKARLLG